MNLLKRIVIAINVYVLSAIVGAIFGSIAYYALVGTVYHLLVTENSNTSHGCSHGMAAAYFALIGGSLAGSTVGCYFASRLLFFQEPIRRMATAVDYTLVQEEWRAVVGRKLRAASHYSCAGSSVIALAGIGEPPIAAFVMLFGLLGVITGGVAFAHTLVVSSLVPTTD